MRGTPTWLVVAAVFGLGLAAAIDTFRGGDDPPDPPATTGTVESRPAEEQTLAARLLRDQSIRGTIVFSDAQCALHAVSLPTLEERPPPGNRSCRFVSTRGRLFSVGPAVPDPNAGLRAICRGRRVEVETRIGSLVAAARGCAPAWKPSGELTAVRDGELAELQIVRGEGRARLRPRVILSHALLRRELAGAPWELADPVVREAAWLTDELVAVIVREATSSDHVLVLFRGTRLVGGPPFPYPRLSALRVSPFGTYVAARIGRQGLVVLDETGELISSGIRTAHAVTWSPDEAWTALATEDGVFVFPTGERAISLIRLPIVVRDLVWR